MRNSFVSGFFLILCMQFAWNCSALGADEILVKSKQLLESKDPQAAYELLVRLQSQRAGDPDYDYLLGIAALDSGKPGEAVFALERVLAVEPGHALARAELARAYFTLGEREAAKSEFEAVRQMEVPPTAADTINKFLDAIEQIEAAAGTQVRGYAEATFGTDSNVNSATSASQIAVPLFAGQIFALSPSGIKRGDTFGAIGAGVGVRHPLSRELAVFGGLNLNKRMNRSLDQFDTGFVDANVGVSLTRQKNVYTAAFQANGFYVDNSRFRDASGVTGQWQYNFDAGNQATAFAQYSKLHYPAQDIRDADRYVLGTAFAHAFAAKFSPVGYLGAYLGQERERANGVPHLGHDLWGLRFGGQVSPDEKTTLFANGSIERRDYRGPDPFFLTTRADTQYDLRIGANHVPAKNWRITPQISLTRNHSNIVINDFNRDLVSVTVRREF